MSSGWPTHLQDHYVIIKCRFDVNREEETPPLSRHRGTDGASRHPHQCPPITVVYTVRICLACQVDHLYIVGSESKSKPIEYDALLYSQADVRR